MEVETKIPKGNSTRKGVVTLEKLHDMKNFFKSPLNTKSQSSILRHEHVNHGNEEDLEYVNIGTCCNELE